MRLRVNLGITRLTTEMLHCFRGSRLALDFGKGIPSILKKADRSVQVLFWQNLLQLCRFAAYVELWEFRPLFAKQIPVLDSLVVADGPQRLETMIIVSQEASAEMHPLILAFIRLIPSLHTLVVTSRNFPCTLDLCMRLPPGVQLIGSLVPLHTYSYRDSFFLIFPEMMLQRFQIKGRILLHSWIGTPPTGVLFDTPSERMSVPAQLRILVKAGLQTCLDLLRPGLFGVGNLFGFTGNSRKQALSLICSVDNGISAQCGHSHDMTDLLITANDEVPARLSYPTVDYLASTGRLRNWNKWFQPEILLTPEEPLSHPRQAVWLHLAACIFTSISNGSIQPFDALVQMIGFFEQALPQVVGATESDLRHPWQGYDSLAIAALYERMQQFARNIADELTDTSLEVLAEIISFHSPVVLSTSPLYQTLLEQRRIIRNESRDIVNFVSSLGKLQ